MGALPRPGCPRGPWGWCMHVVSAEQDAQGPGLIGSMWWVWQMLLGLGWDVGSAGLGSQEWAWGQGFTWTPEEVLS